MCTINRPRSWYEDPRYDNEPPHCPKCDAYMEVEGDKWEGTIDCPECGYHDGWDNLPADMDDYYDNYRR